MIHTQSANFKNGHYSTKLQFAQAKVILEIRPGDDARHNSVRAMHHKLTCMKVKTWRMHTLGHIQTIG